MGTKISQLSAASALAGTELIAGVQNSLTVSMTPLQVKTYILAQTTNAFTGAATFGTTLKTGNGTVALPAWSFTGDTDTGVYSIGANNPAMAAGGVLITKWSLQGFDVAGGWFTVDSTAASGVIAPALAQGVGFGWNVSSGGGEVNCYMNKGGGTLGGMKWSNWDGATATPLMVLDYLGNLRLGGGTAAVVSEAYTFKGPAVNGQVMRVDSPSATLTVGVLQVIASGIVSGSGYALIDGRTSSGLVFQVLGNGNVVNTNNSYGAISARERKQDIVPAASQWNDVKALAAATSKFRLRADPKGPLQIGLIAEDAEAISPGLVVEMDGTKGVAYSVLYMKAVKALGEAMERIEALEARLTSAGIA